MFFMKILCHLGYERVYLPLGKVAGTPLHIQGDYLYLTKIGFSDHLFYKPQWRSWLNIKPHLLNISGFLGQYSKFTVIISASINIPVFIYLRNWHINDCLNIRYIHFCLTWQENRKIISIHFYPLAIKAVGYSDHQRWRAVSGRVVQMLVSAITL